MIRFVLHIRASDVWYGNYWTISCYHSFILGYSHVRGHHFLLRHSHLDGFFNIEMWSLNWDSNILQSWCHFGFSVLNIFGLIFHTHLPFHSIPKHSTLDTFTPLSILLDFGLYFFSAYTFHHDLWRYTILLVRWGCKPIHEFPSWDIIYLLDFGFNIFHHGRA